MRFLDPARLWWLALAPVLAALYLAAHRRRGRHAVRFTNLELLASVAPKRPEWRRHAPAAAMLAALVLLVVGYARPARDELVPLGHGTVVLAIDVSASMAATDVRPDRITAAQAAAADFTDALPPGIKLGLIAFDGTARVLVQPTTDRPTVIRAIDSLRIGPGTATGDAVLAALAVLRADLPDLGSAPDPRSSPGRIVVLADGKTTVGTDPAVAARSARDLNVPVFTVAFGTYSGTVVIEGQIIPVPPDEEALADLAAVTGGEAFAAASGDELRQVYRGITTQTAFTTEPREMTATLLGFGLVLLLLAAGGSLLWASRLP